MRVRARLWYVSGPFSSDEVTLTAETDGIVICAHRLPLVNEGEALFHIARFESTRVAADTVDAFQADELPLGPVLDEEPPIV